MQVNGKETRSIAQDISCIMLNPEVMLKLTELMTGRHKRNINLLVGSMRERILE